MQNALLDMQAALAGLTEARETLRAAREKAASLGKTAEWEHHEYRISAALAHVQTVQDTVADIAPMLGQLRSVSVGHSSRMENAAIFTLRGGIVFISGVTFAANRFANGLGKPQKTFTRQGIAGLAGWLLTGNILGAGK